jgi:hypothetical protein
MEDNGAMAAVFGPLEEIERIVARHPATSWSPTSTPTARPSSAGPRRCRRARRRGLRRRRHQRHAHSGQPRLPHLDRGAGLGAAEVDALRRLDVSPPTLPIVANVTGEFYARGRHDRDDARDPWASRSPRRCSSSRACARCTTPAPASSSRSGPSVRCTVSSRTCSAPTTTCWRCSPTTPSRGTRRFQPGAVRPVCRRPRLCGPGTRRCTGRRRRLRPPLAASPVAADGRPRPPPPVPRPPARPMTASCELGKLFAGVLEQGLALYGVDLRRRPAALTALPAAPLPAPAPSMPPPSRSSITGAALGLPGVERVFDDANVAASSPASRFISAVPPQCADAWPTCASPASSRTSRRRELPDHRQPADVIKLAGRMPRSTSCSSSASTRRATRRSTSRRGWRSGAGFDAMRDAGIPLVMRYKTTTLGTQLPDHWGCPEALRDDTGVVFASAFPGYDRFADEAWKPTRRPRPPRAPARAGRRARAHGAMPRRARGRPADRRAARPRWQGQPYLRPALPVPRAVDGALAVRRDDRRPRPEHAGQRRLCVAPPRRSRHGRGLDPRRPLPPRHRGLRRRRHRRAPAALDRQRLPRHRRRRHRRAGRGRGHALRPAPPRHDRRHGRGGLVVESPTPPASAASSRSARCSAR